MTVQQTVEDISGSPQSLSRGVNFLTKISCCSGIHAETTL